MKVLVEENELKEAGIKSVVPERMVEVRRKAEAAVSGEKVKAVPGRKPGIAYLETDEV